MLVLELCITMIEICHATVESQVIPLLFHPLLSCSCTARIYENALKHVLFYRLI